MKPVRRYFTHAIASRAPLSLWVRLKMRGRVKADLWPPFRAEAEVDGRSFSWRARVGLGPLTLAQIADGYSHGLGSTDGRRPLFAKADEDTARSAAGRTALESAVFAAPSVLSQRGVARRSESDDTIVGRFKPSTRTTRGGGAHRSRGAVKQIGDCPQTGSAGCCGAGSGLGGSGGISGSPGGLGIGWSGSTGPGTSNEGEWAVWVMVVSYPPHAPEKPRPASARPLHAPRARSGWRDRRDGHG
jgi:hypothetical protein